MDAAPPLIHVDDFHMQFGPKVVLDGLSFDVARGETFGFLDSKGSGNTTTIRALLGIYRPTAGTLHINGRVFSDNFCSRLGYFGQLKGLSKADAVPFSRQYLDRMDLAEKADVRVDKLPGGAQQKIQLGVTIMNDPELLILDEPTKGFGPVNRRRLMDIIEERKDAGATVMMVTHQMEEVERLCDSIILLKDGRAEADVPRHPHTPPHRDQGRQSEMPRHTLRTVVGFEFTRTLKKRRFWLAALAIPVGGTPKQKPGTAVERVKTGSLNAWLNFPANPTQEPVKVHDAVAKQLVRLSAQEKAGSSELAAAVQGNFSREPQSFKDGQPSGGLETVVPPLLFIGRFILFTAPITAMLRNAFGPLNGVSAALRTAFSRKA